MHGVYSHSLLHLPTMSVEGSVSVKVLLFLSVSCKGALVLRMTEIQILVSNRNLFSHHLSILPIKVLLCYFGLGHLFEKVETNFFERNAFREIFDGDDAAGEH